MARRAVSTTTCNWRDAMLPTKGKGGSPLAARGTAAANCLHQLDHTPYLATMQPGVSTCITRLRPCTCVRYQHTACCKTRPWVMPDPAVRRLRAKLQQAATYQSLQHTALAAALTAHYCNLRKTKLELNGDLKRHVQDIRWR